jgi:hypothetical protein
MATATTGTTAKCKKRIPTVIILLFRVAVSFPLSVAVPRAFAPGATEAFSLANSSAVTFASRYDAVN